MDETLWQRAEVVRISDDTVWVKPCLATGCAQCQLSNGCGQGVLARWAGRQRPEIALVRDESVTALLFDQLVPGDQVELGVPSRHFLQASALQFLLPLLMMVCAAVLAEYYGAEDSLVALLAFSGLAVALWVISWWRRLALKAPYIHRVFPRSG